MKYLPNMFCFLLPTPSGLGLISVECGVPRAVIESAFVQAKIVADLDTILRDKHAELEHEISRVHRRMASDVEKDRREYLESWIADYRHQQEELLRLITEGAATSVH